MTSVQARADITGRRFGRLVAVRIHNRRTARNAALWVCECDCGNSVVSTKGHLVYGNTSSCGCWKREDLSRRSIGNRHGVGNRGNRTHGQTDSPEFYAYHSMLQRCYNEKHVGFRYYGGRGIAVCARWNPKMGGTFENFLADVGHRPSPKHSIDRIDTNGNYRPDNVRWATHSQQMRNRRPFKISHR